MFFSEGRQAWGTCIPHADQSFLKLMVILWQVHQLPNLFISSHRCLTGVRSRTWKILHITGLSGTCTPQPHSLHHCLSVTCMLQPHSPHHCLSGTCMPQPHSLQNLQIKKMIYHVSFQTACAQVKRCRILQFSVSHCK